MGGGGGGIREKVIERRLLETQYEGMKELQRKRILIIRQTAWGKRKIRESKIEEIIKEIQFIQNDSLITPSTKDFCSDLKNLTSYIEQKPYL